MLHLPFLFTRHEVDCFVVVNTSARELWRMMNGKKSRPPACCRNRCVHEFMNDFRMIFVFSSLLTVFYSWKFRLNSLNDSNEFPQNWNLLVLPSGYLNHFYFHQQKRAWKMHRKQCAQGRKFKWNQGKLMYAFWVFETELRRRGRRLKRNKIAALFFQTLKINFCLGEKSKMERNQL